MTRARLALVCLALASGCGRSGVPESPGASGRWPRPHRREFAEPVVWHSWDVEILDPAVDAEPAVLTDAGGAVAATVELYESGSDFSVVPGTPFGDYAALHPDNASQQSETVRYEGGVYPYAGKSLTARVIGEPAPAGVFDLQLHPPNNDRFVVAAFVTPMAGHYVITGFGAHRFLSDPGASYVAILLGSDPDVPGGIVSDILLPTDDGVWQTQGDAIDLGMLPENERICFAVYRGLLDGNAFGDATEVSFTITRSES